MNLVQYDGTVGPSMLWFITCIHTSASATRYSFCDEYKLHDYINIVGFINIISDPPPPLSIINKYSEGGGGGVLFCC